MKTLNFWVFADRGFDTARSIQDVLRDFCRENPDVSVTVEIKTYSSLWEELFSSLKNPRDYPRPDLVQIPCTWVPTFGHMGLLDDLAALAPGIRLDHWIPGLREYCALPGRPEILSLPWWMGVRVLYYRKDLFEAEKLDPGLLATWEGFQEACRRMQKRFARNDTFHAVANPNPKESVSLIDLAPYIWVHGGQFFSADGKRALFHRDEAFRGAAAYVNMLVEGWMPLLGRAGMIRKDLFQGHAALQFSGRYPKETLAPGRGAKRSANGIGERIGAVPFPKGPAGAQTIIASRQLAVLKGSKYSREAGQVVQYLTRAPAATAYARGVAGLPCTAEALEDWFKGREDLRETFTGALATARPLPAVSALGVSERVLDKAMESVIETVLHHNYKPESLKEQLIYAAAEVDYILSLYE